jgi:hypothetical protein
MNGLATFIATLIELDLCSSHEGILLNVGSKIRSPLHLHPCVLQQSLTAASSRGDSLCIEQRVVDYSLVKEIGCSFVVGRLRPFLEDV